MPKVFLTGAGPGDVELLTLKAVRVIQNADVLIYDRLVNPKILEMVKPSCDLIYVGKEDKRHTLPQEDINELIYQASLKYENVVRLKGGDPFVFGRGGEEALYLFERNIEFEIIPGITSAVAVPAYAGIPVTHRGITTSFRVVTGHENPKKKISPSGSVYTGTVWKSAAVHRQSTAIQSTKTLVLPPSALTYPMVRS